MFFLIEIFRKKYIFQQEPGTSGIQNEEGEVEARNTNGMPLQNLQLQFQQPPPEMLASEQSANETLLHQFMSQMQQQVQELQMKMNLLLQKPDVLAQQPPPKTTPPQQPPQDTTPPPHGGDRKGPKRRDGGNNAGTSSNRKKTYHWCYYLCIH